MMVNSRHFKAEKYVILAELYIKQKKYDKATIFIQKAEELEPSEKAKALFNQIKAELAKEEAIKKRPVEIRRIKKCNKDDYYKILNVKEDASDKEIKTAFRKISLLVHPDKNNGSKEAEETFKIVDKAFNVLSNPVKRRDYDSVRRQSNGDNIINRTFYAENFSHRPPRGPTVFRTERGRWQWESNDSQKHTNIHLPRLLCLAIVILLYRTYCDFFPPDPLYSLKKSQEYQVPKFTKHFQLPYYIQVNSEKFRQHRGEVEKSVEEEYALRVQMECDKELQKRDLKLWKARNWADRGLFLEAHYMKMPSCDRLVDMQKKGNTFFNT